MARPGRGLELGLALCAAGCFLASAWHERLHPAPFEPSARGPDSLRIVTWNVGAGIDQGGGGFDDANLEHVAGVLAELDPDLVLLQEVRSSTQLGRLVRSLQRRAAGGRSEPAWEADIAPDRSSRRVAVLARGGRLRDLELDDDALQGRQLGVRFERADGTSLSAVALHASAFSAAERNRVIGSAVDALLALPDAPTRLLLGDLNLDLDLDKRRDLFSDDEYLDVETYNYVSRFLDDTAARKGPTAEPDRRLDYVFVRSDLLRVRDAGPWRGRRGVGMDHDPVVLDMLPR